MTTSNTIKSFVKQFIGLVTGDDNTVKAEKVFRQVQSALNTQVATLTGDTIGLEDKVSEAKETLANSRVNNGEVVTDRNRYVRNLLDAKNALTQAEEDLDKHTTKLDFLKAELAALDTDVEA